MIVTSKCAACGYEPLSTGTPPADCPNCGAKCTPALASIATAQVTLVEGPLAPGTPERHPSSSARLRAGGPLPNAIDGFEIISLLGYGGMGSVYLAYEPLLDREVALKVLARIDDDTVRARSTARFLSEAVLTGKLGHAGIIPIFRVGFDPFQGYYYTMRYVKGRTLFEIVQLLATKDPAVCETFSLNRLLTIFLRVCEAIGFAHRHGIVHRDIKPSNIMIADFGEVFVVDWGLAKATTSAGMPATQLETAAAEKLAECRRKRGTATQMFLRRDERAPGRPTSYLKQLQNARPETLQRHVTQHDQILGTPGYLSPEQGAGKSEITFASDVYSLGVSLYEILSLTLPVEGKTTEELVARTIVGQLIPIKQRPEALRLPDALCEIINRALALKPEDRYPSAKEMAEELSVYLEGKATWKPVASDTFSAEKLSAIWQVVNGSAIPAANSLAIEPESKMRCIQFPMGDFRCECEFWAGAAAARWAFVFGISEILPNAVIEPRYELRIGVEERPFIELIRNGARVQRRFDLRLQADQVYRLKVEMEASHLRVWIEGREYLDYNDVFPQTGGAIELGAGPARLSVASFSLVSRGAPLHLSFMVLPDGLYRTGRFAEARHLYRHLASSHPDREEGLIALYKAGLCSTAIQDMQSAFTEFTRLEGTMYDHCCALGLAQIGLQDGNIDWAWEALKNGYRRNREQEIGHEMWFALLSLVERLDQSHAEEKIRRFRELLADLDPAPHEAAQLTFELLDLLQQTLGDPAVRAEAIKLLQQFDKKPQVISEALLALARAGIDRAALPVAAPALDAMIKRRMRDCDTARFYLLRAEISIASRDFDAAAGQLRDAMLDAGPGSSIGRWAKGWQILLHYLRGNYQQALTEIHEFQVRQRRSLASQTVYFRLLEALAYLGKGQQASASAAFRGCAELGGLWGQTAHHALSGQPPAMLVNALPGVRSSQLAEALFLAAEAIFRSGNSELAMKHYQFAQDAPYDRAMTQSLIEMRLAEISRGGRAAKDRQC